MNVSKDRARKDGLNIFKCPFLHFCIDKENRENPLIKTWFVSSEIKINNEDTQESGCSVFPNNHRKTQNSKSYMSNLTEKTDSCHNSEAPLIIIYDDS